MKNNILLYFELVFALIPFAVSRQHPLNKAIALSNQPSLNLANDRIGSYDRRPCTCSTIYNRKLYNCLFAYSALLFSPVPGPSCFADKPTSGRDHHAAQWGSDEEEDWEEIADEPPVLANPTSMKGPYHQELMCLLKRAVEKLGIGLQQCT